MLNSGKPFKPRLMGKASASPVGALYIAQLAQYSIFSYSVSDKTSAKKDNCSGFKIFFFFSGIIDK